jgi:transposase
MGETTYSTFDIRARAVHAVVEERLPVRVVSQAYGTDRSTIHRWVSRYTNNGDSGLLRRPVSGRPRKVKHLDSDRLKHIVLAPASEYGYETDFWTTRRLIQVIQAKFHVLLSKHTVMRRLHEAGLTYQKPEREYFELSEKERQAWVRTQVPKIRAAVQKYRAILYFQDEANVSLTALLGKTWAPCGQTPKQKLRESVALFLPCLRSQVVAVLSSDSTINGSLRRRSWTFLRKCLSTIGNGIWWSSWTKHRPIHPKGQPSSSRPNPGFMSFIFPSTLRTGIPTRKSGIT